MKHPAIRTIAIIIFCSVLGAIVYALVTSVGGGGGGY